MSMAATEGEVLLISGKSHRLCSSAQRDEMMSWGKKERERQKERWNTRVSGGEKALYSKYKRKA